MACDCIEKTTENITERLKEKNPDAFIVGGKFKNQVLPWTDDAKWELMHEFTYEYSFKKKDGSQSRPVNKYISIQGAYCTFCGKIIKEQEGENLSEH